VIAIDPGGTTGYVIWDSGVPGGMWTHGQLGPEDHHWKLDQLLKETTKHLMDSVYDPEHFLIVCERFDHRNAEFAKLVSVEYIGVVKRFQQAFGATVVWQGSSVKPSKKNGTGWATDDKLIRMGLLITPKTPWRHANDAMRHFTYWAVNNPKAPPELRNELLLRLKPS